MNARGDMMPKALNLTDMLWQRTEGSPADRARENGAAKANKADAARRQAPMAEFIPEQQAPARQEGPQAQPKSFHDRVKESQAKLGRKDHSFFKQSGNRIAQAGNADRNTRLPRNDEPREAVKAPEARGTEAPAKDVQVRGDQAPERTGKAGRTGRKDDCGPKENAETWTPGESRPIDLEAVESDAAMGAGLDGEHDLEGGMTQSDFDALENRLEELGITATPEQLKDPAFLAEMLWMIDAIPAVLPVTGEALPVEGEAAVEAAAIIAPVTETADADAALAMAVPVAAEETATADAGIATPAKDAPQAADDFDWTSVEEPEREEIAALIREKLGSLSEKPAFQAAPGDALVAEAPDSLETLASVSGRAAAAALPAQPEISRADLALADPDRLRVLQVAGLNGNAAAVPDINTLRVDIDDMGPLPKGEEDDLNYLASGIPSDGKASDKEDRDSLPDLLGRNQGRAAMAETAGNRESAASRDGSATPTPFQSAIESARASEARLAQQAKAPALQYGPSGTEQAVLAQISRKMSALGMRGTEEIRIQLEPEHLGRVRIALDLRDGNMNARISVENDSVRQMVDQNLAGLRQSLEDQGIKLQGLEVSVEQRHSSLFNPDGSNAREFFRQRGNGGSAGEADSIQDETAETDTGRRLGYNTMEYIA